MKVSKKIMFSLLILVSIFALSITTITLSKDEKLSVNAESVQETQATMPDFDISYAPVNNFWYNYSTSRPSGNGTASNPYKINYASNLAYIAYQIKNYPNGSWANAHYKLTSDIDLGTYYWYPIDNFTGTLDGDYHIIYNMTIDNEIMNYGSLAQFGLFANINGGTIKNLGILDAKLTINVSGNYGGSAGILAGWVNGTSQVNIEKVTTDGFIDISSTSQSCYAGGVVGHFTPLHENPRYVSDLKSNAVINLLYSTGPIRIGGIVGCIDAANNVIKGNSPVYLSRCIYTGSITGGYNNASLNAGAIIGSLIQGTSKYHSLSECYYDKYRVNNINATGNVSITNGIEAIGNIGDIANDKVIGLTTSEIISASTFASTSFDFTTVWEFEPATVDPNRPTYPRLKGFTYKTIIYHKITFYIPYNTITVNAGYNFIDTSPLLWAIKYIQHGFPLDETPPLLPYGNYMPAWIMQDDHGVSIDVKSITASFDIYATYIDPDEQCLISIYMMEELDNGNIQQVGTVTTIVKQINTSIGYLDTPQYTGFTFVNWYENRSLTTELDFNKKLTGSSFQIYAKMERITYNVNFYDLTFGTDPIKTEPVKYGYSIEAFEPDEKYGYNFGGWFTYYYYDNTLKEYIYSNPFSFDRVFYGNASVYCKRDKVSFNVRFIANDIQIDKDGEETTEPLPVLYQELIPENLIPTIPSVYGYTNTAPFWSIDGENALDFTTFLITEDVTITAVYTINEYTVTFMYSNDVMLLPTMAGVDQVIDVQTVKHGENAIAPSQQDLERIPSYRFNGWDKTLYDVQQNRTIYATYIRTAVNLIFRSFDGSQVVISDIAFGSSFLIDPTLNNDCPSPRTREGYDQNKPYWNMESFPTDGTSGLAWYNENTKTLHNISSDITISAKYIINKYTVKYILPDGNEVVYEVEHGGTIGNLPSAKTGLFERVVYSKHLDSVTQDEIITVKIESFALQVYIIGGSILSIGLIILVIRLSRRRKIGAVNTTSLNRLR